MLTHHLHNRLRREPRVSLGETLDELVEDGLFAQRNHHLSTRDQVLTATPKVCVDLGCYIRSDEGQGLSQGFADGLVQ
jgi:hypothetical protein